MIRSSQLFFVLLAATILTSCFKKDEMIMPHPRGDVKTDTLAMTESYLYQLYFRLDSGEVVKSNVKTGYDLGFECSPTGWHIILNTSDFMKVADLGIVQFGMPYDTTGKKPVFDKSDGNPDSTAIGKWYTVTGQDTVSNHHVYAISLGLDEAGNPLGLRQVIFDSLKRGTYYFRYAPLNGGEVQSRSVTKDPTVNYLFFNLRTGIVNPVEPPKSTYDLLFSQYTTMLYTNLGIPYPYLVTGVLLNRYKVEAAVDSVHSFSSIDRELGLSMSYSSSLDRIGYDWKYYSFSTGAYTIRPNLSYLIRDVNGILYKLRFIGFYNKNGSKGYPVVEYQQL